MSNSLVNRYPFYAPRFWHGMRVGSYLKLLCRNRFKIRPSRYAMTGLVGGCTLVNSLSAGIQQLVYGARIRRANVAPPLFVLGHWRTGTTLLHELLSLDSRFAYPSNFDCFVPSHFLATQWFLPAIIRLLLPRHRPMDDVPLQPESPQEDEFALLALGAPTPYWRLAFPGNGPVFQSLLNPDHDADPQLQQLKRSLEWFFKALTVRYGQRTLVLKSPPHTGRIAQLARWFPGSRFVHISRDPQRVVPSTLKLWQALDQVQSFQPGQSTRSQLLDYIFESQARMYNGYFGYRSELPANRLCEISFEALVQDPATVVKNIYQQLELGDFRQVSPALEQYWQSRKSYRSESPPVDGELAARIRREWRPYAEAFGYSGHSDRS